MGLFWVPQMSVTERLSAHRGLPAPLWACVASYVDSKVALCTVSAICTEAAPLRRDPFAWAACVHNRCGGPEAATDLLRCLHSAGCGDAQAAASVAELGRLSSGRLFCSDPQSIISEARHGPVHVAAENGWGQTVKRLTALGASASLENEHCNTPLMAAMASPRLDDDAVLFILRALGNINLGYKSCPLGHTALVVAAAHGRAAVVQLLLGAPGVALQECTQTKRTALMEAAAGGHTPVVAMLLAAARATPDYANAPDAVGSTALMLAAQEGHLDAVAVLLADPAVDPGLIAIPSGHTALTRAAAGGHSVVVRAILSAAGAGARPAHESCAGCALSIALSAEETNGASMVAVVLEAAPTEALELDRPRQCCGVTPLVQGLRRAAHCSPAVLAFLLEHSNLLAADAQGRTPLMHVAEGASGEAVQMLLQAGLRRCGAAAWEAAVNARCTSNLTALMRAAQRGAAAAVLALMQAPGVDVLATAPATGSNALTLAIHARRHATVLALARAAPVAVLNQPDGSGATPLLLAITYDMHEAALAMLGRKGIDAGAPSADGMTPVLAALRSARSIPVLRALLINPSALATVNAPGPQGKTALTAALVARHDARSASSFGWAVDDADAVLEALLGCAAVDVNIPASRTIPRRLLGRSAVEPQPFAGRSVAPLIFAMHHPHDNVPALLLQRGADPLAQDPETGTTPLLLAAEHDAAEMVRLLLARCVSAGDVNARDMSGKTAVSAAAASDSPVALAALLEDRRADPHAVDHGGAAALFHAARMGNCACLTMLLGAPGVAAAVDARTLGGETALMAAARVCSACVSTLLAHGADAGAQDGQGRTVLAHTARAGNAAALGEILGHHARLGAAGAAVAVADAAGMTPLAHACVRGNLGCVAALLDAGADQALVDAVNRRTPLMHAIANCHADCTALLLSRAPSGAVSVDAYGNTPLMLACRVGAEPGTVSMLLRTASDSAGGCRAATARMLDARDAGGASALMLAASTAAPGVVLLLLQAGSPLCAVDRHGRTALAHAVLASATRPKATQRIVVLRLLATPESINVPDNEGYTPFMHATRSGLLAPVKALLTVPAADARMLQAVDAQGRTAGMLAAEKCHKAVCEYLEQVAGHMCCCRAENRKMAAAGAL